MNRFRISLLSKLCIFARGGPSVGALQTVRQGVAKHREAVYLASLDVGDNFLQIVWNLLVGAIFARPFSLETSASQGVQVGTCRVCRERPVASRTELCSVGQCQQTLFAIARFFAVVDGVLVRVQRTHYRIR